MGSLNSVDWMFYFDILLRCHCRFPTYVLACEYILCMCVSDVLLVKLSGEHAKEGKSKPFFPLPCTVKPVRTAYCSQVTCMKDTKGKLLDPRKEAERKMEESRLDSRNV
jgi:hypothetical protein